MVSTADGAAMQAAARKLFLTLHVSCSVGWLGSVAAFLALAIVGLRSDDPSATRVVYVGSELVTAYVIVPLCIASLATGIVQGLVTPWGILRHYWVVAKLAITVLSTLILLLHTAAIEQMARAASVRDLAGGDFRQLRVQLVADAAVALVALLVATALSVYKPRGLTPYGWKMERRP